MGRHAADAPADAPKTFGLREPWARAGLWTVRGALVLVVLVIVLAVVDRPAWERFGYDDDGFPRAALPNAALFCAFVLGIGWQWFTGLATPSSMVRRDGDDLRAVTLIGPRRVRVPGALLVRFRVWTNVGTVHGMIVVDRRCRALVVGSPVGTGDTGRTRALVPAPADSFRRALVEHILGIGWLLSTVVAVFVLILVLDVLLAAPGSRIG
ncbi:hypothetical protein ACTJKO_01420 [Curtobacterium sp. 22159]|uniref:hypothetical protein n=1 Tax=Curtobacterium sp. 22159 TaxID=3453882 RepID=UPI003F87C501